MGKKNETIIEKIYRSIGLSCIIHNIPINIRVPLKKEINHTEYIYYRYNPMKLIEDEIIEKEVGRIIKMFMGLILFYIAFAVSMI